MLYRQAVVQLSTLAVSLTLLRQVYTSRAQYADDDGQLPANTVSNLSRMVANLNGPARVSVLGLRVVNFALILLSERL